MIAVDHELQCLRCTVCQEVVELRRVIIGDPEKLQLLREEMGRQHRSCQRFAHDPDRARREREFDQRLARELKRAKKAA